MRRKDVEFGSVPDVGKRILDREQYEDQMFMFHVRMVRFYLEYHVYIVPEILLLYNS